MKNLYLDAKYYDITIADLNDDGISKVIASEVGEASNTYLAILTTSFNQVLISIDDRLKLNFGTGNYNQPQNIALDDINGDGLLDVVASVEGDVTDDLQSHAIISINTSVDGGFSFSTPIIMSGVVYEGYVQLQDINGDGKLNILASRRSHDQLGIY